MKRSLIEQLLLYDYRYAIGFVLIAGLTVTSLFWRLGTLLPGLSFYEAGYVASIEPTLGGLLADPLYWPHKLLTIFSTDMLGTSVFSLRLPSVALALAALAVFYYIIRYRFKRRIAVVALGLLATSSWWLSFARAARPEILAPLLVLLLLICARKAGESRKGRWLLLTALVAGIGIYVPLFIYVVLIGLILTRSLIGKMQAEISQYWFWGGLMLFVALAAPLIVSGIRDRDIFFMALGLPVDGGVHLATLFGGLKDSLSELFWASEPFWALRLGTVPLLDLFSAVMVFLGIYHLDHEVSHSLTKFVLLGIGFLLLLMNLSPEPGNSALLLPFIYILIAAGIVVLFSQWYEIFPRNPVARMTALIPSIVLIGAVMWYHQQRYFIAWPGSPQILREAPALTPALAQFAQNFTGGEQLVVVVSKDELQLVEAILFKTRPTIQITTVPGAAEGQEHVAMTPKAYTELDSELQRSFRRRLQPVPTPFVTEPIALWVSSR